MIDEIGGPSPPLSAWPRSVGNGAALAIGQAFYSAVGQVVVEQPGRHVAIPGRLDHWPLG